jgi:hypothetical protein
MDIGYYLSKVNTKNHMAHVSILNLIARLVLDIKITTKLLTGTDLQGNTMLHLHLIRTLVIIVITFDSLNQFAILWYQSEVFLIVMK